MSLPNHKRDTLAYRIRYLPGQLAVARHKVRALEAEARRYGMNELLDDPDAYNRAWDRTVELTYLQSVNLEAGS